MAPLILVYLNTAMCVILTPLKNSFSGSEWDYVILSLVRSLSKDEIDPDPSPYWLREHLGFLRDDHQMNVGLTRARKGLCIIGMYNRNILFAFEFSFFSFVLLPMKRLRQS